MSLLLCSLKMAFGVLNLEVVVQISHCFRQTRAENTLIYLGKVLLMEGCVLQYIFGFAVAA